MRLVLLLLAAAQVGPSHPPAIAPHGERSRANLGSYFSTDDYPVTAWMNEEEGTVRFRLAIDPEGRVASCEVTGSSGSEQLDQRTCEILTVRVRYTPARDASGAPAPSSDYGSVTWRLPSDRGTGAFDPRPAKPPRADLQPYFGTPDYPPEALRARQQGIVHYAVVVRPSGRVQACVVTRSSGSEALDAATCAIFFTRVRYTPAKDAAGRPVAGQDVGHVTWRLPG
jgi:TonB family protein